MEMDFIPLKYFLSIWHFKLTQLNGPRSMSERVKVTFPTSALKGPSHQIRFA
jgi:hypothetical protein